MNTYTSLLERSRLPQPSLQKFAVISIFTKLRSAPVHLGPHSQPGADAISQCLHSTLPAVVDQSVRELCRLVAESKLEISRGLLELQSALEGADPKFVTLFVKGLGFLVRLGFQRSEGSWHFGSVENHPFVKVLSCKKEAQSELVQQVLMFMMHHKQSGMENVCEFLRPFLKYSVLRIPFTDSFSAVFTKELASSMASFCCSFPFEAMPVLKVLLDVVKIFPRSNSEALSCFNCFVECIVVTYTAVLRRLAKAELLVDEAQQYGLELLDTILLMFTHTRRQSCGSVAIVEQIKRLLVAQKDLELRYMPESSSAMLSLFVILIQSDLEYEQLSLLKLLLLLLNWKFEECTIDGAGFLCEELLLIFPVISLLSSPSNSVKAMASDLLVMIEKLLVTLLTSSVNKVAREERSRSVSSPGSISFRLLQCLWFQDQYSLYSSFFLGFASPGKTGTQMHKIPSCWPSQIKEYSLMFVDRRKSTIPILRSQELFLAEMPLFLGAVNTVLAMHPSLGTSALDSLAALGVLEPKLGVPLLLTFLFYNNIFTRKDINYHSMLPKVLEMLPSLASHFVMIPLIVQTILPMLHKAAKLVLQATAIRLLCLAWEANDRVFDSLQAALLPNELDDSRSERNIVISKAASIRDVCRKNPDRGVDLLLSIETCIQSKNPIVQSLGFQGLAHLCEADIIGNLHVAGYNILYRFISSILLDIKASSLSSSQISIVQPTPDFYTAWDVIAKHVLDYFAEPVLAESMCLLLRWGALDAEAYPEASENVLHILWAVGSVSNIDHACQWAKARTAAFEALSQYEVSRVENGVPDVKERTVELLLSERNSHILRAIEGFLVKIGTHEHLNRRRFNKEKRVSGNKIEKLLGVLPQSLFSSGNYINIANLPGAALLCLSFSPTKQGGSEGVHTKYENALVEIAASLQLSRNILVALLALESWKSFMLRWMRADMQSLDGKFSSFAFDKTSNAASDIMKSVMRLAETCIPRSGENMALAIGALCAILPPSHGIKSTASKFLLNWLSQYEHEHRQWTAALSLGLISSCLHVTDHELKFQIIYELVEVLCSSKSTLVKGACGAGLGFSCQNLLKSVEAADGSDLDEETRHMQSVAIIGKVVRSLVLTISQLSQQSYCILEDLSEYFPSSSDDSDSSMTFNLWGEFGNVNLEDDIWGVVGLILGLGSSMEVLYRAGAIDVVVKLKDLFMSWFPHVDSKVNILGTCIQGSDKALAVGSCLVLPNVVAFCQRVELLNNNDINHLVYAYEALISALMSVNEDHNIFHQSFLMASCIGAGNFMACVLNEGVQYVAMERVKDLIELLRKCYVSAHHPLVHIGGMLGVVTAMGAGTEIFTCGQRFPSSIKTGYEQKESSYMGGPLLSSPVLESYLTELVQEIFLVAQNADDLQFQQNAAWAVSLIHHHLRSEEVVTATEDKGTQIDASAPKTISHAFSDDSVVVKLCQWLVKLNLSEMGTLACVETIVAVFRCLAQAPRLPIMHWGSIIRRCMNYEAEIINVLQPDLITKRPLREECIKFSIVHADKFDSLLTFLDELSDISRFRTLELNLQSSLLLQLSGLMKMFSDSRLEKLLGDLVKYFSLDSSYEKIYDIDMKMMLRVSCWRGLYQCLDEANPDSLSYISSIEKLMKVLFSSLPLSHSPGTIVADNVKSSDEWCVAIRCLGRARHNWLLDLLQVSHMDLGQEEPNSAVLKRIQAKAKLVGIGSISFTELGKLKSSVLNSKPQGIWDVLVDIVVALQHAEGNVKRQWLIDALEISCVSSYPTTALQFAGVLAGSSCRYMPLLILEHNYVLSDLPVTLGSLLMEPGWEAIAHSVVPLVFKSTKRIHEWVMDEESTVGANNNSRLTIHESEKDKAPFLLQVMYDACLSLKDYLSLQNQLWLATIITL